MMERILAFAYTDGGQVLIAGTLGGVVRVVTLQERGWNAIGSLVVGAICARYIGPLALPILETALGVMSVTDGARELSGFLAGLGGVTIAQLLLRVYELAGPKRPGGGANAG